MRVSYHTARRKRRTVCPHKESQSAFTPFNLKRMRYESLRTDKRKTLGRFSPPDFINQIRAVRNLQRARSAKFPAQDFFASPITQRAVNVALCVLIRNCSRLSYLLLHPKGCGIKASARIKEKRAKRFSTPDLQSRFRAVRNLQRARSAKFPAQNLLTYLTAQPFLDANHTLALYTLQRICTENNKLCRIKQPIKRY